MKTLTTTNVKNLIGKTINWKSPAHESNFNYEGLAKIESVEDLKIKAIILNGDNLNFAFLDKTIQGKILNNDYCFSDENRFITFEEI